MLAGRPGIDGGAQRGCAAAPTLAGETVRTPPGEEHWHGGTSENMMCHDAILEETEARDATVCLEPVTDADDDAAHDKAGVTG